MYNRLIKFLYHANILTPCQHGFRSDHSTESAIYDLLGEIYNQWNEGKTCIAIICELSKAFDMVDHQILLHKLERYGIRGNVLRWFETYLLDRSQFVSLAENGESFDSNKYQIITGVPQGSVLGPLLFNIYVNDLPKHITSKVVMYADDTTCIVSGDELQCR